MPFFWHPFFLWYNKAIVKKFVHLSIEKIDMKKLFPLIVIIIIGFSASKLSSITFLNYTGDKVAVAFPGYNTLTVPAMPSLEANYSHDPDYFSDEESLTEGPGRITYFALNSIDFATLLDSIFIIGSEAFGYTVVPIEDARLQKPDNNDQVFRISIYDSYVTLLLLNQNSHDSKIKKYQFPLIALPPIKETAL